MFIYFSELLSSSKTKCISHLYSGKSICTSSAQRIMFETWCLFSKLYLFLFQQALESLFIRFHLVHFYVEDKIEPFELQFPFVVLLQRVEGLDI